MIQDIAEPQGLHFNMCSLCTVPQKDLQERDGEWFRCKGDAPLTSPLHQLVRGLVLVLFCFVFGLASPKSRRKLLTPQEVLRKQAVD